MFKVKFFSKTKIIKKKFKINKISKNIKQFKNNRIKNKKMKMQNNQRI